MIRYRENDYSDVRSSETVLRVLALGMLLAGCNVTLDRTPTVTVAPPDYYTRAEIDAINAELECRLLARNLLQASRCGVRR